MKRLTSCLAVTVSILGFAGAAFADGGRKYAAKCAACHGKDGKGQTEMGQKLKVPDLSDPAVQAKFSDADATKQISEGNEEKKMPAFKDKLSDDEIKDVVAYVRTLAAPK